jgi:hypothetical protein
MKQGGSWMEELLVHYSYCKGSLFGEDEESFYMQKLTLAMLCKFFGFLETEYPTCRD